MKEKYSIMYDSLTGNTKLLGESIETYLGKDNCEYCGYITNKIMSSDILFIGFWTNMGTCTTEMSDLLSTIHDKKIFLFGTAGYSGNIGYFNIVLNRVKEYIPADNTIIGEFMCQGRMQTTVKDRYEKILKKEPSNIEFQELLKRYNLALEHPNKTDIDKLKETIENIKNN
ncbi:MAG: flavodoxin family protein [Bacilli bacterium]